jgi:transposase-like protein
VAKDKAPNWAKIKAEYLKGCTTYRALAAKHGVSFSTLEKRARREGWDDSRRQTSDKVATELPHAIAAIIISETAQVAAKHYHMFDLGLRLAEGMANRRHKVESEDGEMVWQPILDTPKDLDQWMSAVKKGTEGQRVAKDMNRAHQNPADDDEFNGSLWADGEGLTDGDPTVEGDDFCS